LPVKVLEWPDPNYTTIIEGGPQFADQPYMRGEETATRRYVCGNCSHI
jgi:hypothetical protein